MCHLISRPAPALIGSIDGLCDLALEQLADLSREVHVEEYSHFDVLTGVRTLAVLLRISEALTKNTNQISWRRALDTLDARIGSRSRSESEPLRRWREVIEKAYADFQEKLPGYQPSLFASLALVEDGRTEDSVFPNLMLAAEREPYGL